MKRASNTFSVLQTIAATSVAAILLWSVGLPCLRLAEAASVTTFSDTLSTSEPGTTSNHLIQFTSPTGLAAGEAIVITFSDGAVDFDLSTIGSEDIDIASSSDYSVRNGAASGETWGVSTSTSSITLTSGSAVLIPNAAVTIKIGTNALFEAGFQSQVVNPSEGAYPISLASGADTGETQVAILDTAQTEVSDDNLFTFIVAGVGKGVGVNSGDITGGATTGETIPFGVLDAGIARTAAQNLSVTSSVKNGFVVTVQSDGQLESESGADIDGYIDGSYTASPIAWTAPNPTPGNEWEYGHWGLSSDDTSLTADLSNLYNGGDNFVSASTTAVEVFRHDGPVAGEGEGEGTTKVIYKVEVSSLQESATDYGAKLTYLATPVF